MSELTDNVCAFVRHYTGDESLTDAACIEFLDSISCLIDLRGEFDIDLERVKSEFACDELTRLGQGMGDYD